MAGGDNKPIGQQAQDAAGAVQQKAGETVNYLGDKANEAKEAVVGETKKQTGNQNAGDKAKDAAGSAGDAAKDAGNTMQKKAGETKDAMTN